MEAKPALRHRIIEAKPVSDTATKPAQITARHKSPPYPAFSLEVAVDKARQFFNVQKRNPVHVDVAINTLGYKPQSSSGIRALAALIHYGLLTEQGSGDARRVLITELARKILMLPDDDSDRKEALQQAATNPKIFREIQEHYPEELPSDQAIGKYLTFTRSFNPDAVPALVAALRDTWGFAGLAASDTISEELADGKKDGNGSLVDMTDGMFNSLSAPKPPPPTPRRESSPMSTGTSEARTYAAPLSGGRAVILQMPPDMTAADLPQVTQFLELLKNVLPDRPRRRAVWHASDGDRPVVVVGSKGIGADGREYLDVAGTTTGIPADEVTFEDEG